MPRTKKQFEEMRVNSKLIIAETALRLFTTEGYHTTSISKIAKEAGVAIGLMYNYYESKEDLLLSIIDDNLQKMFKIIPLNLNTDSEDINIQKLIDSIIEVIMKEKDSWRLIISVMFQPDVAKMADIKIYHAFSHYEELFEKYYINKGVTNPALSAQVLTNVLHGALLHFACSQNADNLKLIQSTLIKKLLEAGT